MISTDARYERCLAFTLSWEGGFSDNPDDPGGATQDGITLEEFRAVQGAACTVDDLKAMSPAVVNSIYRTQYWARVFGDQLPPGVDLMLFDGSVNEGVHGITLQAQRTLSISDDGIFGMLTLKTLLQRDPKAFVDAFVLRRSEFYKELPTFDVFGRGWINRLTAAQTLAHAWISQT